MCSTNSANVEKNGLSYADLCGCREDDEECENSLNTDSVEGEHESETYNGPNSDGDMYHGSVDYNKNKMLCNDTVKRKLKTIVTTMKMRIFSPLGPAATCF